MVSLGNNYRSPGGGFHFNTDISSNYDDMDEASLVSSVLMAENEPHFKTFSASAWFIIVLQNVAIASVFLASLLIYELAPSPCFYMYVTHVGLWCLIFLTSCCMNRYHSVFKRCGYLEFHRKTRHLIKIPFIILSFGNAVMLIIASILHKFCPDSDICPTSSRVHCEHYSLLIFNVEFIFLLCISIKYLAIVVKFCRDKSVPDVHHDEVLINCIHSHSPTNEIGFKEEDFHEEMLERQADMIRYLKQHNIHLSRKILKLTSEINAHRLAVEL